jgi:ribosomal protein S1
VPEWSVPPPRPNPDDDGWDLTKQRFPAGALVEGLVVGVQPFGAFLDLGDGALGLMEMPAFPQSFQRPGSREIDYPELGTPLAGRVVDHHDSNRQIRVVAENPIRDIRTGTRTSDQ